MSQNKLSPKNKNIFSIFKNKKVYFYDKIAKNVIFLGGIFTIFIVLLMLVFIFFEAYPLWVPSSIKNKKSITTNSNQPILNSTDEYNEILTVLSKNGKIDFINIKTKEIIKTLDLENIQNSEITTTTKSDDGKFIALGYDSGLVKLIDLDYHIKFDENENRTIEPEITNIENILIDSSFRKIEKVIYKKSSENKEVIVAKIQTNKQSNNLAPDEIILYKKEKISISIDEEPIDTIILSKINNINDHITALALDNFCEKLLIGTSQGIVYFYSLKNFQEPELIQTIELFTRPQQAITQIEFLIGDQTAIIGNQNGTIISLNLVQDDTIDYGRKFIQTHIFPKMEGSITHIQTSIRNKCFLVADSKGNVNLYHLTSERLLLELKGLTQNIIDIFLTPKTDGATILYQDNTIIFFEINNPHPEITTKVLFGKVWYEGYKEPAYVWQSTGGSDDFEPKFSLIPLIFGTLKGTFYALLFAIPISLLGAIYTSLFAHHKIKNLIKPTVEIMAALPSVVIGFLAGIWLASIIENIIPHLILMFILLPTLTAIGVFVWHKISKKKGIHSGSGKELIYILPLIGFGVFISIELGHYFELLVFDGNFINWLNNYLNVHYDQRNAIVVGFAMGFAVIPIIFTICEDSLSSVPEHLKSSSYALGATKWQTAIRIVLPTASPGIFSAIMVGFGRAIGETMIVLMATGNTPILDFSPFNGMRTLSANIAVEIPEAPVGGTLYRVLFLSATLLFVMTFIVNTLAEVIRQRLRKKFMHI